VHECSLGGSQVDPSLGLQALQCLADRLPAYPEWFGEFSLYQVLSRPKTATDDQLEERFIYDLSQQGRACHPVRRCR
jgi:hypothetical protein